MWIRRIGGYATDLDPISEVVKHQFGVVHEVVDYLRIRPATELLQALRQVPVVESHHGRDVEAQQFVDQVAVVLDAWLVHVIDKAGGQDPWP